jgi:hypothetical protein
MLIKVLEIKITFDKPSFFHAHFATIWIKCACTQKTKKVIHQTIHILNIFEQEQKGYGAKFTKKNEKKAQKHSPNSLMSYIFIYL